MIDPILQKKADDLMEEFSKPMPLGEMRDKYNAASPEDKKQYDAIKKESAKYLRNKDFEGLKRYLNHTKAQLK